MKSRIPGAGANSQANMMQMLQQVQADIATAQEQVEASDFTACVGGGAVEATVSGEKIVKNIKISPDVVDPEDVEMLQDLIIAAVNEAIRKAEDAMVQSMEKAKGGLGAFSGLGIPGLG